MKAFGTLVTGDAGGGKTTALREMFDKFAGLSVWIDHTGAGGISGQHIDGAATVRSAREARQSTATRLRWVTENPIETAREVRQLVREYHEKTGYPSQVIIDEAHNLLPSGDVEADNPVKKMLHEDRDHGVKVVLATQDPSDLEYTPLKQCKYWVWVGEWSVFHKSFLNHWSIPKDELPEGPYRYVVFNKRMEVVYRGETKAEYGT